MICQKCRNEFVGSPKMHKCAESEEAKLFKAAAQREQERKEKLRNKCLLFDFNFDGMWFTAEMLIAALKALPKDAVVVGIFQVIERNVTTLAVCSEEFEELKPGTVTPRKTINGRKMTTGGFVCWIGDDKPAEVIADEEHQQRQMQAAAHADERRPQ